MNFNDYSAYIEGIITKHADELQPPYNNQAYLDFTKSNWKRMVSWFDTAELSGKLIEVIKKINKPQHWLVITEAWSGDAAQNIPFIEMAARENSLISISYELRDSAPHTIDRYLTNGTRSIPKLVIRDENGNDLGTWGARPQECQELFVSLVNEKAPFEKLVTSLENWYSASKGADIQRELKKLIAQTL